VGHAGRKDRAAVTTQWLSVPWPIKAPSPAPGPVPAAGAGEIEVLSVERHRRKLPVGALAGNHFTLTLRAVEAPRAAMIQRLLAIARLGVPNYFGGQRFGRDHRNLERAGAWLLEGARARSRNDRSMLISAARSAMFNTVLASRVRAGRWQWPQTGDLLTLDDRGSLFAARPAEASFNRRRAAGLRIHPTGPLPGRDNRRQPLPETLAAQEGETLADWQGWIDALAERAVVADRRALRLSVRGLAIRQMDATTWQLGFGLTRGAYATTVLRELIADPEAPSAAE
jgi:tRNA pseudouridine13 synthase